MPRTTLLPAQVAVLGFARSGRALTEALVERGVEVAVADDRPETGIRAAVAHECHDAVHPM